jgi:hypothetical protein
MVDKALKRYWCITLAEGHYHIFLVAVTGPKSCLPLITLSYADLVESIVEADLGEDLGLAWLVEGLDGQWCWATVADHHHVEYTIVDDRSYLVLAFD